jgi:hypothetical protein
VHVREYEDEFLVHLDRIDPRSRPLRHLMMDSPETLISIAAGLFLAARSTKSPLRERRVRPFSGGILRFLLVFFATNGLVRLLKKEKKRTSFSDKFW